jgi:hypothetical protein
MGKRLAILTGDFVDFLNFFKADGGIVLKNTFLYPLQFIIHIYPSIGHFMACAVEKM